MTGSGVITRPRGLGVIFLVLFIDLIGFSIVFPLLAAMLDHYLQHDQGLLHLAMAGVDRLFPAVEHGQRAALFGGLIAAVYSFIQFVAAPFWGRLSDRIGRKPVLIASVCGTSVAYLIWIFSGDFTVLLLSRVLAGLMTGNVSVANAAVADITTPETRSKGMALVGMAFGLGFILGPAIGGLSYAYLPRLDQFPALAALGANPFSTPAAIAFILSVFNLILLLSRFTETLPMDRRSPDIGSARTANPLRLFSVATFGRIVVTVNAAFLVHTLLFSGLEATLVFLAAQCCGFGPKESGLMFAWMGFTSALVQGGLYRPLVPRLGHRRLALLGLTALIPGFLVIASVDALHHNWLLIVGVTILSVGTGLVFPSLSTMVSLAADPTRQGWIMGSFRSAGSLGRALGPLIAAIIYFAIRPSAPYLFGAVGILVPILLIMRLRVEPEAMATK